MAEIVARVCRAVDACHVELIFVLLIELLPGRRKMLAVWAPWSHEFYEPRLVGDHLQAVRVNDQAVEVLVVELHHLCI